MKSAKSPKDFPNMAAYDKWADAEWNAGRYCQGCQAVGVKTDYTGHCAECVAAYDARQQKKSK